MLYFPFPFSGEVRSLPPSLAWLKKSNEDLR